MNVKHTAFARRRKINRHWKKTLTRGAAVRMDIEQIMLDVKNILYIKIQGKRGDENYNTEAERSKDIRKRIVKRYRALQSVILLYYSKLLMLIKGSFNSENFCSFKFL